MSPQFVDFDGNGRLDIVAGIFDGSPHLVRGTEKGWAEPEQILDKEGDRIVLNMFWNFETERWDETDAYDAFGHTGKGHMTSAVAFDWEGDGDQDLLLGDHNSGRVLRRINEGSAREPRFSLENEVVLANGAPIDVPGTVATLRLVDWNRDGLLDLACSGMGDVYGDEPGGGIYVYLNTGTAESTTFGAPLTLLAPSAKGHTEVSRPDSGLYMDFGDPDGDGDLDMLVGGHSHWRLVGRPLTDTEREEVATLQALVDELDGRRDARIEGAQRNARGLAGEAAEAAYAAAYDAIRPTLTALTSRRAALTKRLDTLVPGPKRQTFVWHYENLGPAPAR